MRFLPKLLVFAAVPIAAFLTFIAQPVIGKILTPRYGGSTGTWMTLSLFFQSTLLAGYAFAFWLLQKPTRTSFRVFVALALIAPLLTQIPPLHFQQWPEVVAILAGLVLSLGPALILTTSAGILIQGWVARDEGTVPYHLYGISNIGSAAALFAYPFWIEPHVALSTQVVTLKLMLGVLGFLGALLAWVYARKPASRGATATTGEPPAANSGSDEKIFARTLAFWAILSFSTCTVMLGAIRLMSAELGSNPIAWVVPLGIYLLSFTLTFTRFWPAWLTTLCLLPFGAALFGYSSTTGFSDGSLSPWLLGIVGASCLCGHALLYHSRPAKRFALFYLVIASGGACAGLAASVVFPALLSRNYEFLSAALLLWLLAAATILGRRELLPRFVLLASLVIPMGWLIDARSKAERSPDQTVTRLRNSYGSMTITENAAATFMTSGTTLHGIQLKGERAREATAYYTRDSGLGIVLGGLQRKAAPLRIAAIGLGVGTIATYARPGDEIVFWEINPLVERTAREHFTFLRDSRGRAEVRLEDGRVGVRRASGRFDVLVLDAFSGDSVPMHLLTRDAFREYFEKVPDGYLLVHISNRYFDLMPVLAFAANESGRYIVSLTAKPKPVYAEASHASASHYAILYPPSCEPELEAWVTAALRSPAVDYTLDPGAGMKPIEWTDERHAILDAYKR
jgi:hypothetical protein